MVTHRIVLLKKWLELRGVICLGILGILPLLYHLLTVTLQGKKDVIWSSYLQSSNQCWVTSKYMSFCGWLINQTHQMHVLLTYHTDLNHFPWTSWFYWNQKKILYDKQKRNKEEILKELRKDVCPTCSFTWFWLCQVDDTQNACQHCNYWHNNESHCRKNGM